MNGSCFALHIKFALGCCSISIFKSQLKRLRAIMANTRKCLTLDEKYKVVKLDEGGKSARKIAEELGVGKTQIQNILKRKFEVIADYEDNVPGDRKRKVRKTGNEEINELTWRWFGDAKSRNISVTGPMLKEKALKFAMDLQVNDFKASNGWLEAFWKRHNVIFASYSGESADVNDDVVSDWKQKLTDLCAGYSPENIFNMDETGLFFRAGADKTLHVKGESCKGGKKSKERLTVSLCASMVGEKERPVVIGKSQNPRCFKNIKISKLPVTYYANKKAWMTSALFEKWLTGFDKKMQSQRRQVLLFLDNAPAHPKLQLKNVKLQFFPANTTSKLQPMDQGIIQAMKLKYRKRQVRHLISSMDKDKTMKGNELLKNVSVLEAIYWINTSWKEVETTTIQKCFVHSGFSFPDSMEEGLENNDAVVTEEDDDDVPLSVLRRAELALDYDFQSLVAIDEHLTTYNTDAVDWDTAHASTLLHQDEETDGSGTDNEEDSATQEPKISFSEAKDYANALRQFALQQQNSKLFDAISDFDDTLLTLHVKTMNTQSSIRDFLV